MFFENVGLDENGPHFLTTDLLTKPFLAGAKAWLQGQDPQSKDSVVTK
jgi:hypothetical protein